MTWLQFAIVGIFCFGAVHSLIDPKHADNDLVNDGGSIPVDISHLLNNRAFSASPGDANMDGIGGQSSS